MDRNQREQVQKRHSATGTIVRQLLTGVISICVGAVIVHGYVSAANSLDIEPHDFPDYYALGGWTYGGIELVLLVFIVPAVQFGAGLSPGKTLCFTLILTSALAATLLICNPGLLFVTMLFLHKFDELPMLLADGFFTSLVMHSVGLSVGIVHAFVLWYVRFDKRKHEELLSNASVLQACKAGILPYHRRARDAWILIISLLWLAAVLLGIVFIRAGVFVLILLGCIPVWAIWRTIAYRVNLRICYIDGPAEKAIHQKTGTFDNTAVRHITCQGRKFLADEQVWQMTPEGAHRRFWYTTSPNHIIAVEDIAGHADLRAPSCPTLIED